MGIYIIDPYRELMSFADDCIDGVFCETCGVFLDGDAPGHPRRCAGCQPPEPSATATKVIDLMAALKQSLESEPRLPAAEKRAGDAGDGE